MNGESVNVSQAWGLGMNWEQGWSGLVSFLSVCPQQKHGLLNPTWEFLLCSRPLEAPGCMGGFRSWTFRLWWFRVIVVVRECEVFVCRCAARVLKVSRWVRRTLELHKTTFLSQRCNWGRGFSPLFCCWLEHKEHSSAVNQRTKVTDSTPN